MLQMVVEMMFVMFVTLTLCYVATLVIRSYQNSDLSERVWLSILTVIGFFVSVLRRAQISYIGRVETTVQKTVALSFVEKELGPFYFDQMMAQEVISDLEIRLMTAEYCIYNAVDEELGFEFDEFDNELKYNHFSEEELIAALKGQTY